MRTALPSRIVLPAALVVVAVLAAPEACLFPSYTFDLPPTSSSSSGSGGATSSTSTTTTTTTSSGGGTGGGCAEVDCSDPACLSDYECVEQVPTGWDTSGYVALYDGPTGQTPPDCPAAQPDPTYNGHDELAALPADCTPCGCGGATGQDCQFDPTLDYDMAKGGLQPMQVLNVPCGSMSSSNQSLTVPPAWGGGCYFNEGLPGGQMCGSPPLPCNSSVESAVPQVTGGMCGATGGTKAADTAAPTWGRSILACNGTTPGKGCPSGKACVPKPPSPFKAHVCIEHAGQVDCPAGSSFSTQAVYFGGFDDMRGCTSCSCGPPAGGSCEITVSLYGDPTFPMCVTKVAQFVAGANNGCANILDGLGNLTNPAIYGREDAITQAPHGSTCSPVNASTPTGMVTTTTPTTFCCL